MKNILTEIVIILGAVFFGWCIVDIDLCAIKTPKYLKQIDQKIENQNLIISNINWKINSTNK